MLPGVSNLARPPRHPAICISLLMLTACAADEGDLTRLAAVRENPLSASQGITAPPEVEALELNVHARYPHDPEAFTQGLVWDGERLFESAGLYGESSLREVELETGEVTRKVPNEARIFAEGLALVGEQLFQLSWMEHVALVWGVDTFTLQRELPYEGEGWGLCHDGDALVMSDGSDQLWFRDPETFAILRQVTVTQDGEPVERLNELECAQDKVFANVWQTDTIVRIDPDSGVVEAVIDASGLLSPSEAAQADVLNGIAYMKDRDRFLVTGKHWPWLFEVTFEPPCVTSEGTDGAAP